MTKFSFIDIRLMQQIAETGHTSNKVLHIHMIKYLYLHFRASKSSIYTHIRQILYDHTMSVLLFGDELSIPTVFICCQLSTCLTLLRGSIYLIPFKRCRLCDVLKSDTRRDLESSNFSLSHLVI